MPRLRELQLGFAAALLDGAGDDFARHVRAVGLTGARRLQVYRNNTVLNLTGALAAVYPVTRRLVGEGFFQYTAACYIARHPSRSGDLHEFGEHFPLFLQSFAPVAALTYLPDVARLEWAYHQVFHAASHPPLDLAALARVPAERRGGRWRGCPPSGGGNCVSGCIPPRACWHRLFRYYKSGGSIRTSTAAIRRWIWIKAASSCWCCAARIWTSNFNPSKPGNSVCCASWSGTVISPRLANGR